MADEVKYFNLLVRDVVIKQVVLVLGLQVIGLDFYANEEADGVALTLLNTYNVN